MTRTRRRFFSLPFSALLGIVGSVLLLASQVSAQAVDEFLDLDAAFFLTQPAAGELNEEGDEFSEAVASGDFNGDSLGDLVVAAPEEALAGGPKSGVVAIFLGAEEGISTGSIISQADADGANEAGDRFGATVVAGDFNVDGFEDLVVGAPGKNGQSGAVYLFPGSEAGITTGMVIDQSTAAGDQFGTALGAGDFNDDGFEDLVVGAPGENGAAGAVYVFLATEDPDTEEVGITTGFVRAQSDAGGENEAGDRFGAVLTVGDFTGEGFDELTVGAPGEDGDDGAEEGAVSIFYGGEEGITTGVSVTQIDAGDVSDAGDRFGAALEPGDFNDDGFEELIVGAPGEDGSGAVFVFPGEEPDDVDAYVEAGGGIPSSGGITTGFVITQTNAGGDNETGDQFGAALVHAGFNDDDPADLAVGAPGEDGESGAVFVFPGSEDYASLWPSGSSAGFAVTQSDAGGDPEPGDRFGAALTAEDFNDDNGTELAVGAPGDLTAPRVVSRRTPMQKSGAVFVFPGVAVSRPSISQADAGGVNETMDQFGAVEVTGDFNGDGFEDLAVGTPGEDGKAGAVSIFPGSEDGITEGYAITQLDAAEVNEEGDEFGAALAVGDFDDDGIEDLAVGAPGETLGAVMKPGAVFVFPGTVTVGITTGFLRTQSDAGGIDQEGDRFGAALATGDFDFDGFADLAVGTPGEDGHSGAVYTFPGSGAGITSGFAPDAVNGLGRRSQFGTALTAGDFDGDQFADLAVGAPSAAGTSGAVFILPGSTAGVGPGLSITQTDAGEVNERKDRFGAALIAGDLNGDQIADLAVGAPGEDSESGLVFIFPGADGVGITTGVFISQTLAEGEHVPGGGAEREANEAGDEFGAALAVGVFDAELGIASLVVGAPGEAPGENPEKSGIIFVFHGSGECEDDDSICEQTGIRTVFTPDEDAFDFNFFYTQTGFGGQNEEGDRFGAALATGDFNDGGAQDVAVGTPGETPGLDPKSGAVKFIPSSELAF